MPQLSGCEVNTTNTHVKTVNNGLTHLVHGDVDFFCNHDSFFLKHIPKEDIGRNQNGSSFAVAQKVTLQLEVKY